MKEEMTIEEFIEGAIKEDFSIKKFGMINNLAGKMLELEAIDRWVNLMYGVELEIKVKPAERREGRFYGKGLIESLEPNK